jgi:hypothetical protein
MKRVQPTLYSLGGVWNHTYKNVRLQQHKVRLVQAETS